MAKPYISIYLRNSNEGPSCYYRIMQYINEMQDYDFRVNNAFTTKEYQKNINIKSIFVKRIYQLMLLIKVMYRRHRDIIYDVKHSPACIIISREVFPRFAFQFLHKELLKLLKTHKVIWDFDDDIAAFGEISKTEMENLEKYSNHIIVTHKHLRGILKQECYGKTVIMPTTDKGCRADELLKLIENRGKLLETKVNLIWVGTSNNLEFLETIIEILDKTADKIKNNLGRDVVLNIVCNMPYHPKKSVCHIQIKNYKWSRDKAKEKMLYSHVGIMPLKQSRIAEGKGAFKLIQYLSYGLPVIASPVGFNKKVVDDHCGCLADTDEEWTDALTKLITDISLWKRYAQAARDNYEINFSFANNLSIWEKLLGQTVENCD